MRHRRKFHHLGGRPADQRKALMRSLTTQLFLHGEIVTTLARAKALKEEADSIITLAKQGDVHAIRQMRNRLFDQPTGDIVPVEENSEKTQAETVLRRLVKVIGPRFQARQGGYTRVYKVPPRRGDAAEMAIIQLVD